MACGGGGGQGAGVCPRDEEEELAPEAGQRGPAGTVER